MQKPQTFHVGIFPVGSANVVRRYTVIGSKAVAIRQASDAFRQDTGTPANVALDYKVAEVAGVAVGASVQSTVPVKVRRRRGRK